eukprot:2589310-Rhodomonas_salina.5
MEPRISTSLLRPGKGLELHIDGSSDSDSSSRAAAVAAATQTATATAAQSTTTKPPPPPGHQPGLRKETMLPQSRARIREHLLPARSSLSPAHRTANTHPTRRTITSTDPTSTSSLASSDTQQYGSARPPPSAAWYQQSLREYRTSRSWCVGP